MRQLAIVLDGEIATWDVVGPTVVGDDVVLLEADDDLLGESSWSAAGYRVAPLFDGTEFAVLRRSIDELVTGWVRTVVGELPDEVGASAYHELVRSDAQHLEITSGRRSYPSMSEFPLPVRELEQRVSSLLGTPVQMLRTATVEPYFGVRIIRPGSADNNPPHRDAWLDVLRDTVTAYVPICGSTERSSLSLVPASHHWPESWMERTAGGATIGGRSFTVPAVVGAALPLEMVRPNPAPGEVLLFSPYLIHGGARNLEPDVTRVSLELRFMRRAVPCAAPSTNAPR